MDKILSPIKERILKFVDYQKIKKEDFYTLTGISASNFKGIGAKSELGGEKIVKILTEYDVLNPEWLITGKGDMIKVKKVENLSQVPAVITVDNKQKDNIVLVPVKAQAGYLTGFNDEKFITTLPTYNLPNINHGIFRMFQIKGRSMFPTLHENSYVVGQFVENWIRDIKDNRIYIIVSQEDGVIVKRVLNRIKKYGNLYCKSDNRNEYPNIAVDPETVKEIWECKMHLSYEFLDPANIFDKIYDLEAEVEHLKTIVKHKS